MNNRIINKIKYSGASVLAVLGLLLVIYSIRWITTCGIIKLITMCFGWTFKWSIATGIWLICCVLKSIFGASTNK